MSDLSDHHHLDILRRAFAEEAAACGDPTTARLMLATSAAYGRAAIEAATNRAAFAAVLESVFEPAPSPAPSVDVAGRHHGRAGMSSHGQVHGSGMDQAGDEDLADIGEDRLQEVVRTMRGHQRIATAAAGLSLVVGLLSIIRSVS